MQTVPDPELDRKLRRKIIAFVGSGAVATAFVIGVYCGVYFIGY
jgi:hypothetical protein